MRTVLAIIVFMGLAFCVYYVTGLINENDRLAHVNKLHQATIDSIKEVKAEPPDTTIHDTTIIQVRPITFTSDFDSLPEPGADYSVYRDSIVNDSIRVWANIKAENLYQIDWKYQPVINERIVTISKPHPVIVPEYIPRPQSGFFATGGIGFGPVLSGKAGIIYLNESGFFYGGEVIQFGNNTGFGFTIGKRVW